MRKFLVLTALMMILAGCSSSTDPGTVVEQYLQARVESNVEGMRALVCTAREGDVELEAASFQGREARLEGVDCTAGDATDAGTTVQCTGQIVASYQGEESEFAIGNYLAVQEDGEWRACGEAE